MSRQLLAQSTYILILLVMVSSGLWVIRDCRRRGRPWGETLAWGLFAGWFLGIGLVVYFLWNQKFNK